MAVHGHERQRARSWPERLPLTIDLGSRIERISDLKSSSQLIRNPLDPKSEIVVADPAFSKSTGATLLPSAAARGDGRDARRPRLAAWCCRPAAASRCASRRRRCVGDGLARRRLAADLADEGPGRHARRQRRAGGLLQQLAAVGRRRPTVARGVREGRYRLLYVAPERLVGEGGDGFLDAARVAAGQLRRRRRGALHQPVGPRLPARVPPARRGCASCCPASACTPTPPPRPRACGATSSRSSACAIRSSWSARSIGRTWSTACCARSHAEAADPRRRSSATAARPASSTARRARRSTRSRQWLSDTGVRARAVSRRPVGRRAAAATRTRSSNEARRRRRGDGRVRHGHRSLGRALRRPRRRAAVARALPAGVGPRRPRRPRGRVRADLLGRRLPEVAA